MDGENKRVDVAGLDAKLAKYKYRRLKKQQTLNIISQIPGGKIVEFSANQRHRAAVKIQSAWRGFVERKQFYENKEFMIKQKATVVIQKWIRRRSKRIKRITSHLMAPDIDKENMEEIQNEIDEWQKQNKSNFKFRDKRKLHYEVQTKLIEYHSTRETTTHQRRLQMQLIDQLRSEIEFLSTHDSRPPIPSKPIQIRAKHQHEIALDTARKPWRKKLQTLDTFSMYL